MQTIRFVRTRFDLASLTRFVCTHSDSAVQALDAISITRNLERVADHATNIAEDVIFWIAGPMFGMGQDCKLRRADRCWQRRVGFSAELLQIDHTLVDLIIVDELDRLPIGRPWITLAVDVATRVVAGFTYPLVRQSVISVALVLTQCVLPKDSWLADRRLTSLNGRSPVSRTLCISITRKNSMRM